MASAQLLLGHFGTDEQLLPGAVREPDRLPAVLRRNGNPDLDSPLRVANRSDNPRNDGTDFIASHQPIQDRPQALQNAVLDLELAFTPCAAGMALIPDSYTRNVAHKITLDTGRRHRTGSGGRDRARGRGDRRGGRMGARGGRPRAPKKHRPLSAGRGVRIAGRTHVGLKGPIGTPIASGHPSVNVALRKSWTCFVNFRPVRMLPGLKTRFPDLPIDLVIFRENTEDLYSGLEHEVVPDVVESLKIITKTASMKIAQAAFEYARREGRKKVTAIHKANIMKMSDGLFLTLLPRSRRPDFPEIEYNELIVDNACMQLVMRPETFDVLVLPNLYGDIVSDLAAGLVGGLGIVPGANLGDHHAVFEAVHGTAPDIAGKGLANPDGADAVGAADAGAPRRAGRGNPFTEGDRGGLSRGSALDARCRRSSRYGRVHKSSDRKTVIARGAGLTPGVARRTAGLLPGRLRHVPGIRRRGHRHGPDRIATRKSRSVPAAAQGFHQIDRRQHATLQDCNRRLFVGQLDGLGGDDVKIRISSGQIAGVFENQRLLGGHHRLLPAAVPLQPDSAGTPDRPPLPGRPRARSGDKPRQWRRRPPACSPPGRCGARNRTGSARPKARLTTRGWPR